MTAKESLWRVRSVAGGTQTDRVYGEGSHLKWPWDIMTIYNVRLNQMGIQKFNEVVRASLQSTDGNDVTSLLKYRGIDATLELAKSPNTKVIVVGASDRMPLILDAGSAPSSGIASFGSPSSSPSPSPSAAPVQGPGRDLTPSPTPNQ